MSTGTFPGPTPIAGLPLLYADRTIGEPPVARMTATLGSVMSALMRGMDGSSTTWMQPSGAPAATAASLMTRAASALTCLA
ncbi:unannotated protein [freshwater metagenome]|uniref:Unannotated protein n=1 Tax=freshwater metagenome TaxID=449393 RepID=A0A6J7M0R7_9ZZZZ